MNKFKENNDKRILNILFPMIISILVIIFIFFSSSLIWIEISDFKLSDFFFVLQLILKNMGIYSVLLSAIVATIFFQSYNANKSEDKDKELKIQNIGHYTLAFPRADDEYSEEFKGDKIVIEICTDNDFEIEKCEQIKDKEYTPFLIKFLTSKIAASNLKNIMVFSDEFFQKNKTRILTSYFYYCEKIKYPSPLYCSAKPTSELINNKEADINRYFNLFIKIESKEIIKTIWVSAITDEGVLLFIKVKFRIQVFNRVHCYCQLLQQTIYFKHNNELRTLYR